MAEKRWIRDYLRPLVNAAGADALRDDVARLSPAAIITTDTIIEGVHFLPDDPIDTVAWKLVRVNVSDLVSKGGHPIEALLNVCWPRNLAEADFARFSEALGEALDDRSVQLIGGDTVMTDGPFTLSMTMTGGVYTTSGEPVRRSGARVGDGIYVTGEIGWGAQGLLDRRAGRETLAARRYQVPDIPSDEVARLIAEHATASMDVSDGLLIDVKALMAASGVGAEIDLGAVPLWAAMSDLDEILTSVTGGDDYQSLFTSERSINPAVATRIGQIVGTDDLRLLIDNKEIKAPDRLGFDH